MSETQQRPPRGLPTSLLHDMAHGAVVALVVTALLMFTKAMGLW